MTVSSLRRPCKHTVRDMGEIHGKMDTDWNAVSTSRGTPRNAGTHLKLAERKGGNLPEELQGVEPCRQLDFRFGASRTVREYTSVVLSPQWVVLCYRGPWTLIHALFASDIFNLRKRDVSRNRPHLTMAVHQAHPQPPKVPTLNLAEWRQPFWWDTRGPVYKIIGKKVCGKGKWDKFRTSQSWSHH